MAEPRKLKRAVIREELVVITGDYISALILNQFLYWTERTRDVDDYIAEEKLRDVETTIEPTSGWVYKKAEDLADEIMLKVAHTTIRRYLAGLVVRGLLEQRHNPKHTWDRTWQYRINLSEVQRLLLDQGFSLEGYNLQDFRDNISLTTDAFDPYARSNVHHAHSNLHHAHSNLHHARAIPEITTEITLETTLKQQHAAATATNGSHDDDAKEAAAAILQRVRSKRVSGE